MIAVDSSTLIAYLAGDSGQDVQILDRALFQNEVALPPVVVTEVLSATAASAQLAPLIDNLPRLEITEGYWERAARLRRDILTRRLKAGVADALICQSCLDHGLPLLTRDRDFRHFVWHGGLVLAPAE